MSKLTCPLCLKEIENYQAKIVRGTKVCEKCRDWAHEVQILKAGGRVNCIPLPRIPDDAKMSYDELKSVRIAELELALENMRNKNLKIWQKFGRRRKELEHSRPLIKVMYKNFDGKQIRIEEMSVYNYLVRNVPLLEQEIEDLRERGQALKPKMRKLNEDIERIKSIK